MVVGKAVRLIRDVGGLGRNSIARVVAINPQTVNVTIFWSPIIGHCNVNYEIPVPEVQGLQKLPENHACVLTRVLYNFRGKVYAEDQSVDVLEILDELCEMYYLTYDDADGGSYHINASATEEI